jgi:hypothetical protein
MPGGNNTYLGALDLSESREQGTERGEELECLTIHDVISLAASSKRD